MMISSHNLEKSLNPEPVTPGFQSWKMTGLRLHVVGVVVFLFTLSCFIGAMAEESATGAVKKTIDEVLEVLGNEELKNPEKKDERQARLEKVIGKRFNYEEMGKRTLGIHWRKLNESQRKEFIETFQIFLSNTYARNVDGYSGEQVQYLKERRKGDFAEVQTKVVSKKLQIPLDYRLLKKENDWQVYDVVIDGVSLVKNFRGQFSRIIKSSSFEGLLKKLQEKNSSSTTS